MNSGLRSPNKMKRFVVPVAFAAGVLCVAALVWIALARMVASATTEQARAAGELLDAHTPPGEALARTLLRPGLRIVIFDLQEGTVVDAGSDGVVTRPLPPGGDFGGGPPGGAAGSSGPFESAVLSLAHVAAQRVDRDDVAIDIIPDARMLGSWLAFDVIGAAAALAAIAGFAWIAAARRTAAERRALEADATERREAAERYQRFLAETGHELRTPLTVLTGYIDILRTRSTGAPPDARILDGMHAEATRMRALVEKTITLARLEAQAGIPRLLDVATAAREAVLTVQQRYPDRHVIVSAVQTGSIVIDADDYAAALGNVLENAIKYAPGSPIAVETRVRDGNAVTAVVDEGPGIAAADRDAIFERFYRGRSVAPGNGAGLGLAIVKRIAEQWNGTAEFESAEGRTVIRIAFPLADEEGYGVAR